MGDAGIGMWKQVNDFKWHRVQQSPHWSVLPEEERLTKLKCSPELVSVLGSPDVVRAEGASRETAPVSGAAVAVATAAAAAPADDGDDEL